MLRLIFIAGICTFLLIPIAGYSSNIVKDPMLLGLVSFGSAYVLLPALLLHLWPKSSLAVRQEPMQSALWSGRLKTADYRVSDVIEVEEMEDEGMHFLLATNGGTLFLSGQYLYELVESGAFPCGGVRLFSNRQTGLPYGIEPIGEGGVSWRRFEMPREERPEDFLELEDGHLYSQSLEEIVQHLRLVQVDARPATR